MQKNTALAAAGALVLTVAGGVSVLSLTGSPAAAEAEQVIATEYVDQSGNAVDPNAATPEPTVIYCPADETPAGQFSYEQPEPASRYEASAYTEPATEYSAYEEDEHEEDEYEEEEHEEEGEYEENEGDEY
jgi:hypothetical protein